MPEVEVPGPIAAPPLRSVEAPGGRLPEGVTFRVERSVSSSSSSNDRAASRTEGVEAEDLGRTASQVNRAIGVIGLTGLAAEESSSEASPSRACEVEIDGLEGVPPTPQFGEFRFIATCIFVSGADGGWNLLVTKR